MENEPVHLPPSKRCPPNGVERARWLRNAAAHLMAGTRLHTRLIAAAICIELRLEEERADRLEKEPMLELGDIQDLIERAATLRAAAQDVTGPSRMELLRYAVLLEARAMGRDVRHVTAP